MHKTKSVDYGIMISGERVMELDDYTLTLRPGDIVIELVDWPEIIGCRTFRAARFSGKHRRLAKIHAIDC